MKNDITDYAKKRYTTKAYKLDKKISLENLEKIKELLRFSASSTNSQPWHFLIASSDEGKKRIAKANESMFPFNNPSILSSSHVVVFCSKLTIDDD